MSRTGNALTITRAIAALLVWQLGFASLAAAATPGPIETAAQRALQQTMTDESASWKAMVEKLESGVFVSLRLKDGTRTLGTIIRAGDETFTFKARTRIPVAASEIAYRDVSLIERTGRPLSPGRKVATGVAIAAGGFTILAGLLAASLSD